jgi:hypothetical protein
MTRLWIESFPPTALERAVPRRPGLEYLPSSCVCIASAHPGVLLDVHREEVNLAVWHRELPSPLAGRSLQGLMGAAPFTAVAEGAPAEVADILSGQLPASAPADLLLDVTDLAAVFSALDDGAPVRVRLEALTHDGCCRWHADAVGLRMLSTYRGAGTEWLPLDGGAAVARTIGRDATPPCAAAQLPTGAVAILKGEGYPNNTGGGCIHRSPPAEPGRRARLLLCIDQIKWNLSE